jgi:hypothetical protein
MSNTDTTFTKPQALMFGRMVPNNLTADELTLEDIIEVLDALPGYTEFVVEMPNHDRAMTYTLMARDIPRPGRRYTCLTTGMEWMDLAAILADAKPYGVAIYQRSNLIASCSCEW